MTPPAPSIDRNPTNGLLEPLFGTGEAGNFPSYTLPYPPSANAYWRFVAIRGRPVVLVSREAREYKKTVALMLKTSPRITGTVGLRLNVFRPRKSGDLDNTIKVLLDSLKGILFEDDKQVVEITAKRWDDKENPRVLVQVIPLN